MNRIKNEERNLTTYTKNILLIIRENFRILYFIKMENLNEMEAEQWRHMPFIPVLGGQR